MSTSGIYVGDCVAVMRTLPEDSVDAVVTDPPYDLTSGKRGGTGVASVNLDSPYGPSRIGTGEGPGGFMGQGWDATGIAFTADLWREVARVLKPGGHLLSFGGSRTSHRMVCAIEDAGFEIRDSLCWLYASGFPKSMDMSKAIDKAAGEQGGYGAPKSAAHAGWIERGAMRGDEGHEGYQRPWMQDADAVERNARQYEPASAGARQWDGWGTALAPAHEPICLARKPFSERTVAANVLRWGTGALNVSGTRIDCAEPAVEHVGEASRDRTYTGEGATNFAAKPGLRRPARVSDPKASANGAVYAGRLVPGSGFDGGSRAVGTTDLGRWPKNVLLDEAAGAMLDVQTGELTSRFFYCAKASGEERGATNDHPTVKPVALMRWLVTLVTPPGGTVLDPFLGSGSTALACIDLGHPWLGIERELSYVDIAMDRLGLLGRVLEWEQ